MRSREAAIAAVIDVYAAIGTKGPRGLFSAANGRHGFITNSAILIFWETDETYGLGNSAAPKAFDLVNCGLDSAVAGAASATTILIPPFDRAPSLEWEPCEKCSGEGCFACENSGYNAMIDGQSIERGTLGYTALPTGREKPPVFLDPYLRIVSCMGIGQMMHLPDSPVPAGGDCALPENGPYMGWNGCAGRHGLYAILNPVWPGHPRAQAAVSELRTGASA